MMVQPKCAWSGKSRARMEDEIAEREQAPTWVKEIFGVGSIDQADAETIKGLAVPRGEVGFECEVVQPKSGRFRTVYVHIPPQQVLALLKMCREAASEQRAKALSDDSA